MIRVFVAPVPFDGGCGLTEQVKTETESCTNGELKAQKASAYSLLAFAVNEAYGKGLDGFTKNPYGKPCLPYCFLSLSHTAGAVAVALSDGEVGVDIENLASYRYSPTLAERTMTADELKKIASAQGRENAEFLKLWTAKESAFKLSGNGAFNPRRVAVGYNTVKSYEVALNGVFALSVAGEGEAEITVIGGNYKIWKN